MFKTLVMAFVFVATPALAFAAETTAAETTAADENAKLRNAVAQAEAEAATLEAELKALKKSLFELREQIARLIAGKKAQATTEAKSEDANKPRWEWTINAKQTYPNSLLAFGTFKNRSSETKRFSMQIVIYKKLALRPTNPPVLGSASYTTGNLQPGESTSIRQLVKVSNPAGPWKIVITGISPIRLK